MLGENPLGPCALSGVLVCEDWLLQEILKSIFQPPAYNLALDREKLNRLLLNCERQPVTEHFYQYFFGGARSLEDFETGVERFRVKAMWLYGNFHFAFKKLATSPLSAFDAIIKRTEPRSPDPFRARVPFEDVEPIPTEDLQLLGYITGKQKVTDLDMCLQTLQLMRATGGPGVEAVLKTVGADKQKKIANILLDYGISFPGDGTAELTGDSLSAISGRVGEILGDLQAKQEEAVEIGKRNTHRYLTLPHLDVYVATSMREPEDYVNQHNFIRDVFSDPQVDDLRLRYFDPTLSYADNRITKGLIEMLMLRRATVTIYTASEKDTLGKDSELAATLAQGKAVIAYVPPELDAKANQLRVDHPLGLQIDVGTGVAHGIIVVRSARDCAKMLRKVLLRERTFTIRHEKGNFLLEETETKSVLRVVSDDPYLTHAFWTFFRRGEDS